MSFNFNPLGDPKNLGSDQILSADAEPTYKEDLESTHGDRLIILQEKAKEAWELWQTNPTAFELVFLTKGHADVARNEEWRIPLAESGLLEFFCKVVSTSAQHNIDLTIQCLRAIGNTCADQDENRARVIVSGCLPSIVSMLNDDRLLVYVISVLFNICVDYEPAQKAVYQAGINPALISLLSPLLSPDATARDDLVLPVMTYICKLLEFVATEEPEANLVHDDTPFVLLKVACGVVGTQGRQPLVDGTEAFLRLTSVALTYLAHETFQHTFLETPLAFRIIMQAFTVACVNYDISEIDLDSQAQLKQVQSAFIATLADLSAQPQFTTLTRQDNRITQQDSGIVASLLLQISTAKSVLLQSAACLMLGNLARSDDICIAWVQSNVHADLINILANPTNVDVNLLHGVLGLLKNLAIPAENKPILGRAGLFDASVLPRLWNLDTQSQIQLDAVSLTRMLLVGCPENVHLICAYMEPPPAQARPVLSLLVNLNTRSDQEPLQMETARAIMTVCRVLHTRPSSQIASTPSSSELFASRSLESFYMCYRHGELTDIMFRLGTQKKYPVLRSELIFVLALMARSAEGAAVIADAMCRPVYVAVIVDAVTENYDVPGTANQDISDKKLLQGQAGSFTESLSPGASMSSMITSSSELYTSSEPWAGLGKVAGLEVLTPTQHRGPPPPTTSTPELSGVDAATPRAQGLQKSMQDVDRENALVLIAQLLQKCQDRLSLKTVQTFGALLQHGGQQLLHERGKGLDPEPGQGLK